VLPLVCVTRSCDWDTGRVLLRKNFYRLPFTPPSLVHRFGPSVFPSPDDVAAPSKTVELINKIILRNFWAKSGQADS
jgi:hypothetical protein